jgi:hypothetical protein
MILKASQRSGAGNLAAHLLNADDNEHVRLHELRGFIADDLHGAFKESEAISRATKCQQHLFSLSMSPPEGERVTPELFEQTIDRIEQRLGLEGQPRAIVFHEKEGRRHAHCVWSRIDAATMTARPLPFFKNRLMEVSRDLYLDHGWKLPRGFENAAERNPTNFTLAEWQQAKRQGIDPRWLKATIQESWKTSDGRRAFERSLAEKGFFLAKGDKRGFVVVDHAGEVHSLPRALDLKTKDVRARLGEGDELASVEATRKQIGERMSPAIRQHIAESRAQFLQRSAKLGHYKMEMTHLHREARAKLEARQQVEWTEKMRERAARLPMGLRGLWHRITGKYQEVRRQNEGEALLDRTRQAHERQALIEKQLDQRAVLQREFKDLRQRQAAQLLELRRDVGRYLRLARGHDATPARDRAASLDLKLGR